METNFHKPPHLIQGAKLFWSTLACLILFVTFPSQAQFFGAPVQGAYSIVDSVDVADDLATRPLFVDMDNDGDLDLLIFGRTNNTFNSEPAAFYQENTGSSTAPSFSSSYVSPVPFGLDTTSARGLMDFVDFDNDGDLDVFYSEYFIDSSAVNIFYQENTGTASAADFASPVMNPFGIDASPLFERALLDVADIDGDGRYEMIVGTQNGQLYFYGLVGLANAEALDVRVNVLPNPVKNQFRAAITLDEPLPQAQVRVFNALGQVQTERIVNLQVDDVLNFSTVDWPAGIYSIQIQKGKQQYSQLFQKQ